MSKLSDKAEKRAAALRDNLKRRKLKAKAEKQSTKKQQTKESNDGTSENE